MSLVEYTFASPFCGLGAGTLGFLQSHPRLFGQELRFRSVGGIDLDPAACRDFEYLTGSPALCADLSKLTPAELRAFHGPTAPDVVFTSPPCKSYSGLLDPKLAETPEYQAMARLALGGVRLYLEAWETPPRLFVLENVPRIRSKGAPLLAEIRSILERADYAVHEGTHDCGELGGIAQHRRRYLMVARHRRSVRELLYQPIRRRVRACGEVLGALPLPEDLAAGPMHRLPRSAWITWVRLALIPAGGDWRDLEGVLQAEQARRDVHRRHHVEAWEEPSVTVSGSGSNGAGAVADPRPGQALTPQAGNPNTHWNKFQVTGWGEPASTIVGATRVGSGLQSVADPRPGWFPAVLGVVPWSAPSGTVTGTARAGTGAFSVADPRLGRSDGRNADHHYAVLPWASPSFTIAGKAHPGCGAYSVADPRVQDAARPLGCAPRAGAYGVLPWTEAAKTITAAACVDNGAFAIADPRVPEAQPIAIVDRIDRSPFVLIEEPAKTARGKARTRRVEVPVVILAADGTWHRPLTPLELARLQDLPAVVRGAPLKLAGDAVGAWVERIGNAVPVGAAEAIARQMLFTLAASDGAGLQPSGGAVWVAPEEATAC